MKEEKPRESKFLDKLIENIGRLDEASLKSWLEATESERRTYRIVFDSLSEGILVLDSTRLVLLNNEARRILLAPNLKTPLSLEESRKFVFEVGLIDFLVATLYGNDFHFQTEWTGSGTKKRFYQIEKISTDGELCIVKITDITEVKAKDSKLKNLESIEALNNLAAGVAHEIRNPLTAIDIHTQLLKKGIDRGIIEVPEEVKNYLRIIDEEQRRLSGIVSEFLTAARKRELKRTFEDVNEYLQEIVDFVQPELDANGIFAALEFNPVPKTFLDRDYLRQAVLNLIRNAIEAMRLHSPDRLPEKRLIIRTFYDIGTDSVGIAISDTGEGIPEERLQRIFEPYYTTKESGTGLGLTIVYKIVKEHGGDIRVESEKGRGSTFTIFLPQSQGVKQISGQERQVERD
jgi:signal transduction histidine kinase